MLGGVKLVLRIAGIVILVAIFVAVYALATNFSNRANTFSEGDKTIGELGGFHFLTDIDYRRQDSFWRVAFTTNMNRGSSLADVINTPHITVQLKPIEEPVLFGTGEATIPELGSHYLLVSFSDTSIVDTSDGAEEYVFLGDERQLVNQDNINEVRLHQPPDDSLYQVLVGVDGPVKFRLQPDEEDTGIVWLDILK